MSPKAALEVPLHTSSTCLSKLFLQNRSGSMMSQGSNFLPRINPCVFSYGICRAAWQPYVIQLINQCTTLHVEGFATGSGSFCSMACQKRHRVLTTRPEIVNLLTNYSHLSAVISSLDQRLRTQLFVLSAFCEKGCGTKHFKVKG